MKLFFKEIRNQSLMIRGVMFVLCVVITVSAVGVFWFRSTEEQLFVALNPDPVKQEEFFAERQGNEETIFANLGTVFGGLRATLGTAFNFLGESEVEVNGQAGTLADPNLFPISGDR
jgi:hypothetical protein